jgi:hypothetical protein
MALTLKPSGPPRDHLSPHSRWRNFENRPPSLMSWNQRRCLPGFDRYPMHKTRPLSDLRCFSERVGPYIGALAPWSCRPFGLERCVQLRLAATNMPQCQDKRAKQPQAAT